MLGQIRKYTTKGFIDFWNKNPNKYSDKVNYLVDNNIRYLVLDQNSLKTKKDWNRFKMWNMDTSFRNHVVLINPNLKTLSQNEYNNTKFLMYNVNIIYGNIIPTLNLNYEIKSINVYNYDQNLLLKTINNPNQIVNYCGHLHPFYDNILNRKEHYLYVNNYNEYDVDSFIYVMKQINKNLLYKFGNSLVNTYNWNITVNEITINKYEYLEKYAKELRFKLKVNRLYVNGFSKCSMDKLYNIKNKVNIREVNIL